MIKWLKRLRISISTKMIVVTVATLAISIGSIAYINSQYFEKKFSEQLDISNLESAVAKSKEVDNIANSLIEKTRFLGSTLLNSNGKKDDEFNFTFQKDKNIIALEIITTKNGVFKTQLRRVKELDSNKFNLKQEYFSQIRKEINFPYQSVLQGNVELKNSSYKDTPPMVSIGIPLVKDKNGAITHIAVAEYDLAILEKAFSDPSERTQYLVDKQGQILAHKDEKIAISRPNLTTHPLVQKTQSQKTQQFQIKFLDPESQQNYFGAVVKTNFGGAVLSQVSEETVLEVSHEVKRRSILFAGCAISLVSFFIFMFSMSLTLPIEKLAELIKMVAKGDFEIKARKFVRSNDEVGDLAKAFDQMTVGLIERDKVKNLFSKFHGTSVAEDLIKKEIVFGGQSKDIVVFFSDIRGFTSYAESRKSEEVVSMLNEYFAVMVEVINRNGGIVDKFIGDAIMAVWGAPNSSDNDAKNALKACLEMRQALEVLNQKRLQRGDEAIKIGMGLHAGNAIVGTIGSEQRMEYTVIGNTVNTGSRIEASTKAFGTDLLISEDVISRISDGFFIEFAGAVEVKGRSVELKMFKVRGYKHADGTVHEIRTPYSDYEAEKADKVKIAS